MSSRVQSCTHLAIDEREFFHHQVDRRIFTDTGCSQVLKCINYVEGTTLLVKLVKAAPSSIEDYVDEVARLILAEKPTGHIITI